MIREANIWDAQVIADLWVKMHEELKLPFIRLDDREKKRFYLNIIAQIEGPDAAVIVSEIDGKVNGFIQGEVIFKKYGISEPIMTVESAYIEPKGGGMALIKAMEDFTNAMGVKHMMFETIHDDRLVRVWGRRGYKAVQITYHKED